MAVVSSPTEGFTAADFDRLGATASEDAAINCLRLKIDYLLTRINGSMAAQRFLGARRSLGMNSEEMFLTKGNYVHGDRGHWYVFHRGGRWEPEFNIGMYGGTRRYIRVGIGFNLTKDSADPNRDAGQLMVKAHFRNFQSLARSVGHALIVEALQRGAPLAESMGAVPQRSLTTPTAIVGWLGKLDVDTEPWIFAGRMLSPEVEDDRQILGDIRELTYEIGRTFDAWLPAWEATMRWHS